MIEKPNLDSKKPIGNGVTGVVYNEGVTEIISTMTADVTNSDTSINQTYDQTDRAKKWENPQVKQDTGTMYSDQK